MKIVKAVQNLPLKWKLILIILFAGAIICSAAITIFSIFDSESALNFKKRRTQIILEVISINSIPALKFRDPNDALEILQSLKADKSIRGAYLYSGNGELMAEYHAGDNGTPPASKKEAFEELTDESYTIKRPVVFDGEKIGSLVLESGLHDLAERRQEMLKNASFVAAFCFLLALPIATALQRLITRPVNRLKRTIERVREEHDYSLRAEKLADDEFGSLVSGFNHMLSEVQERDSRLFSQMKLLEETNAVLDQRVAERTSELQAANRELEGFSYSVSHDLRAPLRSIDGFTQILVEDYKQGLDPEAQRLLGIIQNDVKKMGCLIDDLLAFSRMSRQQMAKTLIDMKTLAEQVFQDLSLKSPGKKIELQLGNLPEAPGDPSMIRQVFVNLISNAIKFSSAKDVIKIEINGRLSDGVASYSVKDNGVGFDERYKEKLFNVFQRLHSEEEFEGTGVGLALIQRILQRHDGQISARSTLGQGAEFTFTLPVNES